MWLNAGLEAEGEWSETSVVELGKYMCRWM